MKKSILCVSAMASVALLTACTIGPGGICGPNIPAIYCASKEEQDRVFHPKAYGEHWVKPGMTQENWRQDWVACGGRSNGQYSGNVPPGSTDAVSSALWEAARKKLDACIQSKGYEYRKN
jgi:hypothetical protein